MRIAKAGFYGGDPEKILVAPVDLVLNILQFEIFENEYQQAQNDIRREAEA